MAFLVIMRTEEINIIKAALESLKTKFNRIADFHVSFGTDSDGDDAIFVVVLLRDRKRDYQWSDVKDLEREIRREVSTKDPGYFPYVQFQLDSDQLSPSNA